MKSETLSAHCALVAGLLCLGSAQPVAAQDTDAGGQSAPGPRSFGEIPQVQAEVTVDGVLDDPLWAQALVLQLDTETNPSENVPAPVETSMYVAEDGARLLIAFDARDPNPEQIRAYLRDRDSSFDDDFVGVVLDTFNDQRRAFEFFVNPLGVQMDLTMDDVNGGESTSWDAIWDSAGRITDTGYVVEMAIPFSQLRFQSSEELQTWGLEGLRFYPRTNRVRMSTTPRDRGRNCYLCQLDKVRGFANVQPGKGIEVVPSLTAARADTRSGVGEPLLEGNTETEVGMNVRWAVTPDMVANFTLNPDFSQVEADVAQLDVNNQFALFFPETRTFFLEGEDYFSTPINAVFTRTIADPDFGAKLTGNFSEGAFGLLAAEDTVTNLLFPGALSSQSESLDQNSRTVVGRYRRNIGTDSAIGALLTSRAGDDYENLVAGVDGRIRPNDRHSIQFQFLRSDTRYPDSVVADFDQPEGAFTGDALQLNYDFGTREWFAGLNYQNFDAGFRIDSGFRTQVDMEDRNLFFGRNWYTDDELWWNRVQIGFSTNDRHRGDATLLRKNRQLFVNVNARYESFWRAQISTSQQFWDGVLYDIERAFALVRIRPVGSFFIGMAMGAGDEIDFSNSRLGEEVFFEPFMEWNPTRKLRISLQGTISGLDTQSGEKIFDAELVDLRATWQFNTRSFLRLTLQQQRVDRNLAQFAADTFDERTRTRATQLLYSYELNPQTVVFVGYSDNHLHDAEYRTLTKTDQTFFMKFSYAWIPR
ncbi:MAG TPA: DUF5916 domain-containing protein [Gammaproteobacteria bacterium]|nr:DUF5916 domain-containing protein [Gammaproteobacteria bacterium]